MTSGNPTASSDNTTLSVVPSPILIHSTTYKIRVTTGVKDPSGNPMSSQLTGTGFTTSNTKTNGCD